MVLILHGEDWDLVMTREGSAIAFADLSPLPLQKLN